MQHKVIQASNTKVYKFKNDSKETITIINTILTNNTELNKHKSHELYAKYSPSNLANNNNTNNNTSANNSKKNTTLANTIKQIIHYSGAKKSGNLKSSGIGKNNKEKDSMMNEVMKHKSNKEYTNISINDINQNAKQEENIVKKLKKNNLDNILSESDSCQEIDSMEEDSLSKGNRIKSTNMNLKKINNMKWDIMDNKTKSNTMNFKKHLTTGFNNNNNLRENKKSISSFTKQKTAKTDKEKESKNMAINNNEDTEEEILVNDNEFDNSRCIQNEKLNETKFPKLSINPFIKESNQSETNTNNDLNRKSISNKINNNRLKNNNKNKEIKDNKDEKIIFTNHHIKSSTLGTIKQSSTNPNSSNLSNNIDYININNINKNNIKPSTNSNTNIDTDKLYRNLLLIAKKGDREKFLEILEQMYSLPPELININYQDENGFSALHFSCDEGNLKIVDILLNANCETNIKNNEKKTPLHLASKRGYFDISKKLIENGALLNVYDIEKNSPIHYVCMYNHIELLKYFLGKLPQADSKNLFGKRPIDLTRNKEIRNILEEYLKKNENIYHKIRIYETSDSKMKNMMEAYEGGDTSTGRGEEEFSNEMISLSCKNNANINLTNLAKNNVNSSISPNKSSKSPKNILRNIKKEKDFNSIQQSSKITKKNTLNDNQHNPNKLNSSNIKISHNNTLNTKSSINSVIKKEDLKNNQKQKENPKKENQIHNNKKNNKVLIQDSNSINNNKITHINKNISGLKKTKTLEQFSSINSNKNTIYKINLMSSSNKGKKCLNDSRINNSNYYNINNSINNGPNRINISLNIKNNENKKLNRSIKRLEGDKKKTNNNSENKSNLLGNNLKNKNLLLDSIEYNNNIINLNKTEENINNISKISKISKASLNKIKKVNISINVNSTKNVNNKNYDTIKIIENKEITLSKSKNKNKKNSKQKKYTQKNKNKKNKNLEEKDKENSYLNNDNNLNNCNISKISCAPQTKNNILDPINKSNIVDQTLTDNVHFQLNLNSIEEERITPSSFICLALLGKGSFGEVYLVQKINTQEKFAMKVLRKERIIGHNLLKYAMAERNVLSLSNHPFIVKLNFAFQTSSKLFLILEYCPNGDLAKHLLFEKRFTEERAKFYICEVLLALENLHQRDIIFRDLKPDNVVLDEEGHCKLTDFGLSKEGVNDNQYAKSFCGSIAYLAPEMLKKQGHGKAVDWYLLGVLFYEMIVGITPFCTTRKEDIFHNIEYGELKIPEFVSEGAASLLRGLLQKDPNKRLGGSIKDAQEIKEHPYFKDVDWDKVYNKELTPPPVIIFPNKIMHTYHRPRLFANDDANRDSSNMLSGWSFINNEES
jgi:hypothetical protein